MILGFLSLLLLFFVVYYFRLYLYLYPKNRLPILMYHKVLPKTLDDLTVSTVNLELQLKYLKNKNYKSYFFKEIQESLKNSKSIILTFDDGYDDNHQFLLPLLKKYNFKATIFIPTEKIEQETYEGSKMMSFSVLQNLDPNYIELALHSHSHTNLTNLSLTELENEIFMNKEKLSENKILFTNVLTYPYGKYPKNKGEKQQSFFETLKKSDIEYALKIGNKINFFPPKSRYELSRIDIKGSDSLLRYKLKLIFGKLKLF